ncbi:MAG: 3-oxoacyl-[acyl-carrier-protein] synthase-3 [Zhongshania aliphaticivorans]|jgi:3-oxoacyl-[acyl-carrier-protein] synthase-3|tara:strand:+ start:64688 stop:65809 length:1122 start_codon:yes stop_codon:yes gene_type:complete
MRISQLHIEVLMPYANITGWGKCLPPAILSNQDLMTFLDTSDEWIQSRTGIKERRISHVSTATLASLAAKRALAAAGLEAAELDMIILGTACADTLIPNAASAVQQSIGAVNAAVFDLNAACTGFVYGLSMATGMIRSGAMKKVLVIGADRIPYFLDYTLRDVCVLFGDGAGAVVLEASDAECGLLAEKLGCDSEDRDILMARDAGTIRERFTEVDGFFDVNFEGPEIFKRAVRGMGGAITNVLAKLSLEAEQIDLLVPHQANIRIIETLTKRLKAPPEKVVVNIEKYGNTSAATVPIALCEALEAGRVKPGDRILTAAFGAGLTWGAAVIKWGERVTPVGVCDEELPPSDKTALDLLMPWVEGCRAAVAAKS